MKPVHLILLSLLLTVVAAGCRSSEPFDNIVRASAPRSFNYVVPLSQRSTPDIQENVGYYIVFDDDALKANITIANLSLPGEDHPLTLTFTGVEMGAPFNNHVDQRVVKADALVSSDPVSAGFVITDVTFVYSTTNSLDPNDLDGIYARYTINGRYVVTAFPYRIVADGTTRIDDLTTAAELIDYTPSYCIDMHPESMTADFIVDGLTVAGRGVDFVVRGLKLDLDENGYRLGFCGSTTVDADKDLDLTDFCADADLLDELKVRFTLSIGTEKFDVAAFLLPSLS